VVIWAGAASVAAGILIRHSSFVTAGILLLIGAGLTLLIAKPADNRAVERKHSGEAPRA
jgi:hypothetical protein